MKLISGMATAAIVALAGCDSARNYENSGFSGIGTEAPLVSRADRTVGVATGTLMSDVPFQHAYSGSTNRRDHAELAIRKGSGRAARAKKVTVGYQDLAVSVVYVNDVPYAVVKPSPGLYVKAIVPETRNALQADARALTGCPAVGGVYAFGPQTNLSTGIAVELGCG